MRSTASTRRRRRVAARLPAEIAQIARDTRRFARRLDRKPSASDVKAVLREGRPRDDAFDHLAATHEAGHALVAVGARRSDRSARSRSSVHGDEMPRVISLDGLRRHIAVALAAKRRKRPCLVMRRAATRPTSTTRRKFGLVAVGSGLDGPAIPMELESRGASS